jgi:LuxR family transcriptional regulator, maltose regulon positive regulatory protein
MVGTILATKLYIPPHRAKAVLRPRLIDRLNEGLHRKLSLISAPAGFGKTTLVSEWVAGSERPTAWLSLDQGDNDPTRFLVYLVAALQTIAPKIGEGVLGVLQSPQPPPTEAILTTLLNEITTVPDDFILVLDDYHVIDAKPVDHALAFVLEHLPPQMHLVIATREDPHLPLARLRVRGQLTELRAADLRFTHSEAAGFLKGVMDLDLSAQDIGLLETRTEGWIAGLQLAAISMRGHQDAASFIEAFTGSHRFVLDYLVEEVLQRQPERVRSFLLQTAVLDRLTGPLCDAVTGRDDGSGMLDALERSNLFVIPLDDKRLWYRYHHLFAEVLQARLMEEQSEQVLELHRRASGWYEHNGSPADAVHHALAAEDFERAAGLIEMALPAMERSYQFATWLGWVKALPDELVQARPVLSMGYAWGLLNGGELEVGETRLRDVERWLDTTADVSERPEVPSIKMVVVDEEQFRSLPTEIATARAYLAQALGDVPGTVKYAQRSLDLLQGDQLARGRGAALLGLAYWASGDLEAAHRTFAASMAGLKAAGYTLSAIGGTFVLGDIKVAQGRLHEAASTYEQALRLAAEQVQPVFPGMEELNLGLSELHRERGDLEAAAQHLLTTKELGEQAEWPGNKYRWCTAMARIKEAQGDLDSALDLLNEAERLHIRTPLPDVRPIAALKSRIWIAQGRLAEALGWVRERGLSVDDGLSYLREFEHITLARALIARYKRDRVDSAIHEAMSLLERLLSAAEEGGRLGSVIEILVLQALAYGAQGNVTSALEPLARALALAEPEGFVRIFVDEGTSVAELLRRLESQAETLHMRRYIRRLLSAFEEQEDVHSFGPAQDKSSTRSRPSIDAEHLVEPLSERELEVLRLIAQGLSNREISERLFRALSTIKGHNRMIFDKLQVKSRTEAVARARELGLL